MATQIFEPDDPRVLSGEYDIFGYKPGERARIEKADERRKDFEMSKAKKKATNGSGKTTEKPKRGPRSEPLPGMEQVISKRLNNLCESINEHRQRMNAARTEELSDIVAALQEMQKRKLHTYKHGGVELARVPGAEKLRIRLTKDHGDADESDLDDTGGEFDEERRDAVAQD